jgi:hypothetical protein
MLNQILCVLPCVQLPVQCLLCTCSIFEFDTTVPGLSIGSQVFLKRTFDESSYASAQPPFGGTANAAGIRIPGYKHGACNCRPRRGSCSCDLRYNRLRVLTLLIIAIILQHDCDDIEAERGAFNALQYRHSGSVSIHHHDVWTSFDFSVADRLSHQKRKLTREDFSVVW